MRKFVFVCVIIFLQNALVGQEVGNYLDQKLPGIKPELFAPGIITTQMAEFFCAFMPDGSEFYFSVYSLGHSSIAVVKKTDKGWTQPEVVSFSGRYGDSSPTITSNGKRMFFISQRPDPSDPDRRNRDIWYVDRVGVGWGNPVLLEVLKSEASESWPFVASNGDLYFSAALNDCYGVSDIYISKFKDGEYLKAENIGSVINTQNGEYGPYISPDGSYLMFEGMNYDGGFGNGDMYISFKDEKGNWTKPVNMGETVNTRRNDCFAKLTPDGKYILFTSDRRERREYNEKFTYKRICELGLLPGTGDFNIYWIDAKIIDDLKITIKCEK